MLGEAAAAGLVLNAMGRAFLATPGASEAPSPDDSRTTFWKVVDSMPRRSIDNGGRWPRRIWATRGATRRTPLAHPRGKTVWLHESVAGASRLGPVPADVKLERASTRRPCAFVSVGRAVHRHRTRGARRVRGRHAAHRRAHVGTNAFTGARIEFTNALRGWSAS
jgi:hypothetical protein